jgi:hypothetical protein
MKRVPRLGWDRSTKFASAMIAIAAYFLVAHWLEAGYVPPRVSGVEPKVAGQKIFLRRPYLRFLGSKFGVIAPDPIFEKLADSADNNLRSPVEIYEDDKRLGPPHSKHEDVAMIGLGRYSHWRSGGGILVFSSSDNSDPETNGRAYWAVRPDVPEPTPEPY